MARPRKLNPDLKTEICERIAAGETVRALATSGHMPTEGTIYLELTRDPIFSENYARARVAQLARWEDELIEIADDATNDFMARKGGDDGGMSVDHDHIARSKLRIDARKWIMAKRLPKKYGDRVATELSGPEGAPIAVENVSAREVAMRLAFLLTKGTRDAG